MEIKKMWTSRLSQNVFIQQVGTTTLSQGGTLILSLMAAAITARWLGPDLKGELTMTLLLPAMLQLFLGLGMGPANVYHVGSGRLPLHHLASITVAFSLVAAAIGFTGMFLLVTTGITSKLLPGVSPEYLLLGMCILPLGLLDSNLRAILQGRQRILTLNALNLAGALLSVLLLVVLVMVLNLALAGAVLAALTVQAATLLASARCVSREGGTLIPRWHPHILRPTLSYGARSYVGNLLQFFNYRLDMFLVNFFLGPTGVGIYGVAVVMAELLWQLPNAASFVIFPKSANSTQEIMNSFTPRVFWTILIITTVGAIGLALFGKLVIRVIFSSGFLAAYIPLMVLLPGVVLLGAAKILTSDIAGRGYPHYNSITSGLSLVATIILDLILIPSMGVLGAALASTASYILTFFLSVGFYFSVSQIRHANL